MRCPHCGRGLSDAAAFCPGCGHPFDTVIIAAVDPYASPKSRLVALLLCFFLGMTGAHRFYVGQSLSACLMLLLFLVSLLLALVFVGYIGLMLDYIWAVIDGILILVGAFRDGDGRRVSCWT